MKGFLLDTNCLSELVRARPNPGVLAWAQSVDEELLYVSVLTLGEIRKGVTLLPAGSRRTQLTEWLEGTFPAQYGDRLLPITVEIAETWGSMAGEAQLSGVTMPVIDGLIAATAKNHNLSLVTRNVRDFKMWRISVINPWEAALP